MDGKFESRVLELQIDLKRCVIKGAHPHFTYQCECPLQALYPAEVYNKATFCEQICICKVTMVTDFSAKVMKHLNSLLNHVYTVAIKT